MRKLLKWYTGFIFFFLYLPIALLVFSSFNASTNIAQFGGFTLNPYHELLRDSGLLGLLLNSIIIALLSALLATLLGTMAAVGIHAMNAKMRAVIMNVTNIPMTNPDIVTGVSLALLFAFVGRTLLINNILGFGTLLIAHITFNLPFVILSVMPKLKQLDPNLNEAALDLGCSPFQALRKVIIPDIMPGIISGLLLSFTLSIDDFVISFFNVGPGLSNLSIEIYSMSKRGVNLSINALSTLMFVTIMLLMILINWIPTRGQHGKKGARVLEARRQG